MKWPTFHLPEIPTRAEIVSGAKNVALRYRAFIPLATMGAIQYFSADVNEEGRHAMRNAADIWAFAVLFSTLTSATEGKQTTSFANVVALVAATATVITASIDFSEPGAFMLAAGPWMIAALYAFARLAAHYARTRPVTAANDATNEGMPQHSPFVTKMLSIADNAVLTIALPLAIAESMQRSALITHNETYRVAAPFMGDAI